MMLSNSKLFCVLELPNTPIIKDLNGLDLSSKAPIFHLGSLLNLSCEVTGGRLYIFFSSNLQT